MAPGGQFSVGDGPLEGKLKNVPIRNKIYHGLKSVLPWYVSVANCMWAGIFSPKVKRECYTTPSCWCKGKRFIMEEDPSIKPFLAQPSLVSLSSCFAWHSCSEPRPHLSLTRSHPVPMGPYQNKYSMSSLGLSHISVCLFPWLPLLWPRLSSVLLTVIVADFWGLLASLMSRALRMLLPFPRLSHSFPHCSPRCLFTHCFTF